MADISLSKSHGTVSSGNHQNGYARFSKDDQSDKQQLPGGIL